METQKNLMDGAATLTAFATFLEALPSLVALLSLFWLLIRLHDRLRYGPNGKVD